ncbi:MAG: flagellar basal body rod C-terminal domain-containing protein [Burkholderiaceae bacterium]
MSFAIGLSGLNAATRRLDAAAWDIARASNQRTAQSGPVAPVDPVAAAGTGAAPDAAPPVAPVRPPAPAAGPQTPAPGQDAEDPDLPRAMVDLISASQAFMANLKTIQRTDDTLESLLKIG